MQGLGGTDSQMIGTESVIPQESIVDNAVKEGNLRLSRRIRSYHTKVPPLSPLQPTYRC